MRKAIIIGIHLPVNRFELTTGWLERVADRFDLGEVEIRQVISPYPDNDVKVVVDGIVRSLKAIPARRRDKRLRVDGIRFPFEQYLHFVLADNRNLARDGDMLVVAAGRQVDCDLFGLLGPEVQGGFKFLGENCIATVDFETPSAANPQFDYLSSFFEDRSRSNFACLSLR